MKNYIFYSVLVLLVGFCSFFSASAQTEKEIQEKYTTFLDGKDLFNKVDADGDVQFQYQEKTYFFDVDENDPTFFRLVLANIWPIESEEERLEVLRAMDIANNKVKVAKIYMVEDNIWVGVEMFQDEGDDYEAYFDRSLKSILDCIDYFVEAMDN